MTAPAVHYRIAKEAMDTFADDVKYDSKEEAERAAGEMITAHGGPAIIYVYVLAAKVSVATTSEDAD